MFQEKDLGKTKRYMRKYGRRENSGDKRVQREKVAELGKEQG